MNDHTMNDMISIIICSIDERKFAAVSQNFAALLSGEPYEIIGIHDAKSLCEGYNRGARQSSGSILIFCHDDIEIVTPDFKEKIRSHLRQYDVVGVAGTSRLANFEWSMSGQPHIHGVVIHVAHSTNSYVVVVLGVESPLKGGIQALDGLFIAMNRQIWEEIRFDENTFDGFHGYDLDFTYSAYRAGFRIAVCSDIGIIHQSVGRHDEAWKKYRECFMAKHHGFLYQGEVEPRELGAIYVADRGEMLEMLQPAILRQVTENIRALARKKMAASGNEAVQPVQTRQRKGFWQSVKAVLGERKG